MSRDSRLNIIVYSKTDCRSNGCLVWNCSFGNGKNHDRNRMANNEENNNTHTMYGVQIKATKTILKKWDFFHWFVSFRFLCYL